MAITNLEEVSKLGVNIYEIENAIMGGQTSFWTPDNAYLILRSVKLRNYEAQEGEVILFSAEGESVLVKKI